MGDGAGGGWSTGKSSRSAGFRKVYGEPIVLVDTSLTTMDGRTLPPLAIKQASRPRKIRLRSRGGVPPENQIRCSKCGEKGHNKVTCERRR